jgi:hypothetical protein
VRVKEGLDRGYQSRPSLLLLSLIGRKMARKMALRIGARTAQLILEEGAGGGGAGVDGESDGGGLTDGAKGAVSSATVNEPGRPLTSTE